MTCESCGRVRELAERTIEQETTFLAETGDRDSFMTGAAVGSKDMATQVLRALDEGEK